MSSAKPPLPQLSDVPLVLGLDGGGTKTIAWLAPAKSAAGDSSQDSTVGRGRAGPGNPRAVGFETAQANYEAAITAAFFDAGLSPRTVAAICLGIAGAGRPEERERLHAWATERGIARRVTVTHDAELVLAAVSSTADGIALISGTGSLAWGRSCAGQTSRCGGWGYLIGDEGSGYDIALAGLRAAARAADGRGPPTRLLDTVLRTLRLESPSELVGWLYDPGRTRRTLAELAPLVFEVSETSDRTARAIIQSAANSLAELVVTLAARLSLPAGGYCLALAGGVLGGQAAFRDLLLERLADAGCSPESAQVVNTPVAGAVELARALSWP